MSDLIVKWRWRMRSVTTGKLHTTRYLMTEAQALALDSQAERVPASRVDIDPGRVPLVTPSLTQPGRDK